MKKIAVFVLIPLVMVGCTTVQRGAGTGAVAGGALGAIIGHQSGHTVEGAGIGAAAGAISGAVVGEYMEKKFCPVCGRRFTSSLEYCPYDGTTLQVLGDKSN